MKTLKQLTTVAVSLGTVATPALAHTGHAVSGLAAGTAHPFMGLDHLLAMVAVGVWAALQPDGRAWRAPALFVGMLAAGAVVGMAGIAVPFVEPGILASVMLFGLMIASAKVLPSSVGLATIAAFAVLHGHAHGTEAVGAVASYMTGFMAASAALHIGGYATGRLLQRVRFAAPVAGLAIAAAGATLLAG
jgi:urease accessory protein